MAIEFNVDLDKLRREDWGERDKVAQALSVAKNTVSRKLNQRIPIGIDEINKIIRVLNLDARDFVYFIDNEKKAEIKNAA